MEMSPLLLSIILTEIFRFHCFNGHQETHGFKKCPDMEVSFYVKCNEQKKISRRKKRQSGNLWSWCHESTATTAEQQRIPEPTSEVTFSGWTPSFLK